MHETVTLQFGNRANYLATHFWNTQESYFTYPTPENSSPAPSPVDHDIHFRPGIGADGSDTYTPRTLIYDFQANFGGLRKLNALYETLKPDEVVKGLWDGIQQTQTNPPIQPISYQVNLESGLPTPQLHARDVRYWSDFNRLYYHPRSIQPLSPQSLSSSLNAADSWSNGVELFKDLDREVDILDRDVRPFAEESDALSAFQIFTGVDDSWGGYASTYVEALREEYGKKSIWVWAVEDTRRIERAKQYQRLANSARSLRAISQHASAYIRLSTVPETLPGYIHLDTGSEWSCTALMCAAVESATLPTRLRNDGRLSGVSVNMVEDTLNTNGNQNIWTLKARARSSAATSSNNQARRNPHNNGSNMSQATDSRVQQRTHNNPVTEDEEPDLEPSSFDLEYTPTLPTSQPTFPSLSTTTRATKEEHVFAQVEIHRYPSTSVLPLSNITRSNEANLRRQYDSEPIVAVYSTPIPFPVLDSYPHDLFRGLGNKEILIDAALSTSGKTKREVLGLRDLVVGRFGRGMGLVEEEEEDVEGMYDDLTRLGEGFDFGWEGSGSSLDEDE